MGQAKYLEMEDILSKEEDRVATQKLDIDGFPKTRKEDNKKHKCTFPGCDAAFYRPSRLARHIRAHTGERICKCSYPGCDKAYTNTSHLKRHMETHSTVRKSYKCTECSLTVSNKHNLKRHYKNIHGDHDKLTCKECNETFTKKYQLATHMARHTPILRTCDVCGKVFSSIAKFRRHKNYHENGGKTYPCDVSGCKEVFKMWAHFCVHKKTQHVIEYKCKDCGKAFVNKTHLKVHSQVHMENRTVIPCPYEKCPRVYYFKRNLEHHIRLNHLGQKYQCDICKVLFSSKIKVGDHIQKLHMLENRIRKAKKLQRRKRKDAGKPKRSAVSKLVGVMLPPKVEKMLLERQENIPYIDKFQELAADDVNDDPNP